MNRLIVCQHLWDQVNPFYYFIIINCSVIKEDSIFLYLFHLLFISYEKYFNNLFCIKNKQTINNFQTINLKINKNYKVFIKSLLKKVYKI